MHYTPPMPPPSDLSFTDSLTSEQRQIFYERHRFLAILMILIVPLLPFAGLYQDAEKIRQRRSRIVQILNVPQRVRLRSLLAAALLDGLFEHPEVILDPTPCGMC